MTESTMKATFEHFIKLDISQYIDKKMGLSYLPWTYAWMFIKEYDPEADKKFKQFPEYNYDCAKLTGRNVDYCSTMEGCYVECTVTIKGNQQTETLPVMDNKNNAVMNPNMMQINKAKQRCFVKCCALFGLGLNLYAGEDEPLDNSITDIQKSSLDKLFDEVAKLNGAKASEIASQTLQGFGVDELSKLDQKQARGLITSISRRVNELKRQSQNKEKVGNE